MVKVLDGLNRNGRWKEWIMGDKCNLRFFERRSFNYLGIWSRRVMVNVGFNPINTLVCFGSGIWAHFKINFGKCRTWAGSTLNLTDLLMMVPVTVHWFVDSQSLDSSQNSWMMPLIYLCGGLVDERQPPNDLSVWSPRLISVNLFCLSVLHT